MTAKFDDDSNITREKNTLYSGAQKEAIPRTRQGAPSTSMLDPTLMSLLEKA